MTANKAASETRHQILRQMDDIEKMIPEPANRWTELRSYIEGMAERASKKEGGLGRK